MCNTQTHAETELSNEAETGLTPWLLLLGFPLRLLLHGLNLGLETEEAAVDRVDSKFRQALAPTPGVKVEGGVSDAVSILQAVRNDLGFG